MRAKYIIAVDYMSSYRPMTIEYFESEAKELEQVLAEVENMYNENTFSISIFRKEGGRHQVEGMPGWSEQRYTEIMIYAKYWHTIKESEEASKWRLSGQYHKGMKPEYHMIAPWER